MELNVQLTQHAWANVNKLLTTAFHLFVEIYKSDASDQLDICRQWSDILRNQSYHANTCYRHRNNTLKPQNRLAKWTGWSTLSQILNIEATAHFWYAKGLFFFTGENSPKCHPQYTGKTKNKRPSGTALFYARTFSILTHSKPSNCKDIIHPIIQNRDCKVCPTARTKLKIWLFCSMSGVLKHQGVPRNLN